MGAGMIGKINTVAGYLAHLCPGHQSLQALIHAVGRDEHGKRPATALQARIGARIGRDERVVDGDRRAALRKRLPRAQIAHDLRQRPDLEVLVFQILEVAVELGQRDAGGRRRVAPEMMVLEHHRVIRGDRRADP